MNVADQLRQTALRLRAAGIESPRFEAEVLLDVVLDRGRAWFYAHPDAQLQPEEQAQYEALVTRRAAREPVAYLTGAKEFMGMTLAVAPGVLIPRPDTECVVEAALQYISGKGSGVSVLDLCTGSGAIALAVKKARPLAAVTASDLSEQAFDCARGNAENLGLAINAVQGDLFAPVAGKVFDLIISNPPYIPTADIDTLMEDVRLYEPVSALDGGRSGLDFYRRIAAEAPAHLKAGGRLVMELGEGQFEDIAALMTGAGFSVDMHIRDLAGLDRGIGGIKTQAKGLSLKSNCDII
jgi:release factor glutamine methyltransferase